MKTKTPTHNNERSLVAVGGIARGVYRHEEYFHKEVSLPNTSSRVWQSVTVSVTDGSAANHALDVFQPYTAEAFTYDQEGNLTADGHWTYSWDAHNRLLRMVNATGINAGPTNRLEFAYDHQGRRISKKVYDSLSGGTLLREEKYLYDGWNLLAVLDGANTLQRSFLWGSDLSGSLQGAGGVGGLLAVVDAAQGSHLSSADANGNVTLLVGGTTGTTTAEYEYGPFGEVIRATGPMAKTNPFRFSTKFQDNETDLVYYGFRSYNPATGRWLSRDPIEERGGVNLYGFVGNDGVNKLDVLGRDEWQGPPAPLPPIDPTKDVRLYNCAGVAFRDYTYKSKSDTMAKLKKDCTGTDEKSRCPCGQR